MFNYSLHLVQRYVEAQCCIASNDYKGDKLYWFGMCQLDYFSLCLVVAYVAPALQIYAATMLDFPKHNTFGESNRHLSIFLKSPSDIEFVAVLPCPLKLFLSITLVWPDGDSIWRFILLFLSNIHGYAPEGCEILLSWHVYSWQRHFSWRNFVKWFIWM